MSGVDLDPIRHALEIAVEKGFGTVKIEIDGIAFEGTLEPPKAKVPPIATSLEVLDEPEPDEPPTSTIVAPFVGYFQMGAPPIEAGRQIKAGDLVGAITALGISNDIEAAVSGEIVEVSVVSGQAVEFGQPIAVVRPVQ